MLRHFYRTSPQKLENILLDLIGENSDELSIGPTFRQQERMKHSIPDAVINQTPLSIFIEAKTVGNVGRDQLLRHLKSIQNNKSQDSLSILLTLTKRPIDQPIINELQEEYKQIILSSTTYKEILEIFDEYCKEYETELSEILQDYKEFVSNSGLLPNDILIAFPCKRTMVENKKYGICIQQSHRRTQKSSKYIGLYRDKKISYIGKLSIVVVGIKYTGSDFEYHSDGDVDKGGQLSNEQRLRIEKFIEECSKYYPRFAERKHRYYLFEEIFETKFVKKSKYAMRQQFRKFDLTDYIKDYNQDYSTEEIAKKLHDLTWE